MYPLPSAPLERNQTPAVSRVTVKSMSSRKSLKLAARGAEIHAALPQSAADMSPVSHVDAGAQPDTWPLWSHTRTDQK